MESILPPLQTVTSQTETYQPATEQTKKPIYIPLKYENIIDKLIVKYCSPLYPFFKKMGFTPNILTTISLILGLLTCYSFYKKKFKLSAILLFLSYIFDVLDGDYARKYKMVTKIGDYYDHIKDIIVYSIFSLIFIKYTTYNKKVLPIILIISIGFLIANLLNCICKMKYLEKNNKENSSHSFLIFDKFPIKDCDNKMLFLRYFDSPSFIVFSTILVFFNP